MTLVIALSHYHLQVGAWIRQQSYATIIHDLSPTVIVDTTSSGRCHN
jgi:hypothetical protein